MTTPDSPEGLTVEELARLKAQCEAANIPHEQRPRPTIAELEAILAQPETSPMNILPDGNIEFGRPAVRVEADVVLALISQVERLTAERDEARRELAEMRRMGDIKNKIHADAFADSDTLAAENARLREALNVAATAELYDPSTGIIDADVLGIVQETASAALSVPSQEGGT